MKIKWGRVLELIVYATAVLFVILIVITISALIAGLGVLQLLDWLTDIDLEGVI